MQRKRIWFPRKRKFPVVETIGCTFLLILVIGLLLFLFQYYFTDHYYSDYSANH